MEANVSGIAKAYAAAETLFGQLQVWQLLMIALHTPGGAVLLLLVTLPAQLPCVSRPPCRQHVTGQSGMHMHPTSNATTGGLGSAHCYVHSIFNSVNPLRKQMLRKQPQYASNDTALARVDSADAATLVATPAAASTFTALQQATTSAACTFGGHSRVMPDLHSVNDASSPRSTTHIHLLLLLHKIFAAKGLSVNYAEQAISNQSATKTSYILNAYSPSAHCV